MEKKKSEVEFYIPPPHLNSPSVNIVRGHTSGRSALLPVLFCQLKVRHGSKPWEYRFFFLERMGAIKGQQNAGCGVMWASREQSGEPPTFYAHTEKKTKMKRKDFFFFGMGVGGKGRVLF